MNCTVWSSRRRWSLLSASLSINHVTIVRLIPSLTSLVWFSAFKETLKVVTWRKSQASSLFMHLRCFSRIIQRVERWLTNKVHNLFRESRGIAKNLRSIAKSFRASLWLVHCVCLRSLLGFKNLLTTRGRLWRLLKKVSEDSSKFLKQNWRHWRLWRLWSIRKSGKEWFCGAEALPALKFVTDYKIYWKKKASEMDQKSLKLCKESARIRPTCWTFANSDQKSWQIATSNFANYETNLKEATNSHKIRPRSS